MKAPNYIIKLAREQKGLSQADFAKAVGVAPATILKCEHGANIAPKTWKKIADYCGIECIMTSTGEITYRF